MSGNIKEKSIAPDRVLFSNLEVLIFFLFLYKNICYGYSLEAPHRGASNEYPQHMFLLSVCSEIRKHIILDIPLFCFCSDKHLNRKQEDHDGPLSLT